MDKEIIIRMAREAGGSSGGIWGFTVIELERFFAAAYAAGAAAERDACAKVCESRQTPGTGSVAILNGAADAIRARGQA